MNRTQILERIAQLDRQMNEKIDQSRVPRMNLKHRKFPLGSWIATLVLFGVWVFGDQLNADLHGRFQLIILAIAVLAGLFSFYATVMWLLFGMRKADKGYSKSMNEVAHLKKERDALQKQLDESK